MQKRSSGREIVRQWEGGKEVEEGGRQRKKKSLK